MPIMLFQCLDLFYSQQIIFSKKIGDRVYRMSSLLPNAIPVTSHVCSKYQVTQYSAVALFTGLKVGACRYILQKMKIHFLQYPKEYLILCV